MEILRVRGDAPDAESVARAVEALQAGQLVIFPTDTLYALGGRALDGSVARRIRVAKGREEEKPLPLVAADVAQARELVVDWPETARRLAERFWPGPLTLVLRAAAGVPEEVTAGCGSVAVRVPALALTRALCAGAGPLVSTSANRAGAAPPLTCADAAAGVGAAARLALDAGAGRPASSTILDLTGVRPRCLRQGPVSLEAIEAALGEPPER